MRLPFRFGVTLRRLALLHLVVDVESGDGRRSGVSRPTTSCPSGSTRTRQERPAEHRRPADLRQRRRSRLHPRRRCPLTFWRIWRDAYPETRRRGTELGLNPLVSGFGSALFERAWPTLLAAWPVWGYGMLRHNPPRPPAEVHAELSEADLAAWVGREPPAASPFATRSGSSIPSSRRGLRSGAARRLPRTLEEYVTRTGPCYFKLKVMGEVDADLDRLERIAAVLDRLIPDQYRVTVDGNEQDKSIHQFARLSRPCRKAPRLRRLRTPSCSSNNRWTGFAVALDAAATRRAGGLAWCRTAGDRRERRRDRLVQGRDRSWATGE